MSPKREARNTGAINSVPLYVSAGHSPSGISVTHYTHKHYGRHRCTVRSSTPMAHVMHQVHAAPREPPLHHDWQYNVGTHGAPRTLCTKRRTVALYETVNRWRTWCSSVARHTYCMECRAPCIVQRCGVVQCGTSGVVPEHIPTTHSAAH